MHPERRGWNGIAWKDRSHTFPPMPKKRDGVMTVRIASEDKEMLLKIADQADMTLSDVVVRAVRDYIGANPVKKKKPDR